jgi:hypothetical protein
MSINTQRLLDAKAIKFGVSAAAETYQSVFLEAVYKTCADLQNLTGMTVEAPADTATDIDIDAKYYPAVSAGIDFYLQDSNMFTANPVPDAEDRFLRAVKTAQMVYLRDDVTNLNVKFGTLESYTLSGLQDEGYSA